MRQFTVLFYEDANGDKPVEHFLLSLEPKMQAKLVGLLEILQEKGNALREPYSKHLCDGIFEIRVKSGTNITRVLYFFYHDRNIILTNGFIKKRQKTPPAEIALAKKRRQQYLKGVSSQ